jgi:hypothetical protein
MAKFGVGVMHNTINSRFGPKPLIHADSMTGLACGADSFWVADHFNSGWTRICCRGRDHAVLQGRPGLEKAVGGCRNADDRPHLRAWLGGR